MIFLLLMAINWILYVEFRKCKTHWRKPETGEMGWDGPPIYGPSKRVNQETVVM